MIEDVERMLICDVCGEPACVGSGVTLEGLRMGDVCSWRCAEHHPHRKSSYTREEWARARAEGRLYPDSTAGEWQKLSDITAKLFAAQPARKAAE
jgi:hypothetical protein